MHIKLTKLVNSYISRRRVELLQDEITNTQNKPPAAQTLGGHRYRYVF